MTPLWAYEAARDFWARAGGPPPDFPRDLRQSVALALPLAVVGLPRLRLDAIRNWLRARGSAFELTTPDRRLHACLVARGGEGIVFLDGADPEDERRYSLAHEVAHFLVEHEIPRRRAEQALGAGVLEVLDGQRSPTPIERTDALLAGTSFRMDVHYLDRGALGLPECFETSLAEQRAEVLAFELLAPMDALASFIDDGTDDAQLACVLASDFGLPAPMAHHWARQLLPSSPSTDLFHRLRP